MHRALHVTGERRLWQSVILLAVQDALISSPISLGRNSVTPEHIADARRFLFDETPVSTKHRNIIFSLAGWEHLTDEIQLKTQCRLEEEQ
jgi:hypothetical protein